MGLQVGPAEYIRAEQRLQPDRTAAVWMKKTGGNPMSDSRPPFDECVAQSPVDPPPVYWKPKMTSSLSN